MNKAVLACLPLAQEPILLARADCSQQAGLHLLERGAASLHGHLAATSAGRDSCRGQGHAGQHTALTRTSLPASRCPGASVCTLLCSAWLLEAVPRRSPLLPAQLQSSRGGAVSQRGQNNLQRVQ